MTVELKNISWKSERQQLFRNLNIEVAPGRILFIKGYNGAGKSTLLKIIVGLIKPDKGEVRGGEKNNICYLGHKNGIKGALTPMENIERQLILSESLINRSSMEKMVKAFHLDKCNFPCSQLSAGEQRKVALAAVILKNKKNWILDEPFNSLDSECVVLMKQFIVDHTRQSGIVIMATHDAWEEGEHDVLTLSVVSGSRMC